MIFKYYTRRIQLTDFEDVILGFGIAGNEIFFKSASLLKHSKNTYSDAGRTELNIRQPKQYPDDNYSFSMSEVGE